MPNYLNHVAIAAPKNGTTTHTVTPSSGTVAVGTLFTPTAGNVLVCIVDCSTTSTTPTGWTLPASGSAVDLSALYVWYRTAAGADSLTTTHGGSNFAAIFSFYEYASGTTFSGSASATGLTSLGAAGPTISGLTGTNDTWGAVGQSQWQSSGAMSISWSNGTEVDEYNVYLVTSNNGYTFGARVRESTVLTSDSSAATVNGNGNSVERLMFAVKPAAASGPVRRTILVVQQAVHRASQR